MKRTALIFTFILLAAAIPAQGTYNKQTSTTPPESGKFEIVTSSIAMKATYLLDKASGDTWQLVSGYYGYAWEKLHRQEHPADTVPEGHRGAAYQITMSGIAVRGCYLTNTLTGATWILYEDSDTGELFWGAVSGP